MKKQLHVLLGVLLLTTASWGDITVEQLNNYLKVSGAGLQLDMMQKHFAKNIQRRADMSQKKVNPEILKRVTEIATKPENSSKFTENILKLDVKDYQKMITFHSSDFGKKNRLRITNMYQNEKKMVAEMQQFAKTKLSPQREKLIQLLVKADRTVENSMKSRMVSIENMLKQMPKERRDELRKQIDAQSAQARAQTQKVLEMSSAFIYKDFSDEEIEKLITYYQTESGQKEIEMLSQSGLNYIKTVMPQVSEFLFKIKREKEVALSCTQMRTLSMSFKLFFLDNGVYPSTEEGTRALIKNPDSKKYYNYATNPYLKEIPLDIWKSPFIYKYENKKLELISYGADHKAGGERDNKDIYLSQCKK